MRKLSKSQFSAKDLSLLRERILTKLMCFVFWFRLISHLCLLLPWLERGTVLWGTAWAGMCSGPRSG